MSAYRFTERSARRVAVAVMAVVALTLTLAVPAATGSGSNPPLDLEAPEIEANGTLAVGEQLSCYPGSWQGIAISFTYEWFSDGTRIASGRNLEIKAEDKGKSITCIVTAKDEGGIETEESWNAVEIEGSGAGHGSPPENKGPPEVSGKTSVGSTLTCSTGEWSGQPAPTFTYEWLREGAVISGASAKTYTVVTADEGHQLSCKVTASNGEGLPASEVSKNSAKIPGTAPKVIEAPQVLGEPKVGDSLTCSTSSEKWSGEPPPTFTYQWLRGGVDIPSATADTYVVQEADEAKSLSCEVTARNSEGEATANSNSVTVAAGAPENATAPEIAGETAPGDVLACSPGTWKGQPSPTFEYEWLRDGTATIVTASTYTITEADQAHTLSCEVFATNSAGKKAATSKGLYIPGSAPQDSQPPEVSGTASVGNKLTCSPGEWKGAPPPTFTYQWLLNGDPIASATASVYTVTEEDELQSLACVVSAKNSEGKSEASVSVTVAGSSPKNTVLPSITGTPAPEATLTCLHGTWSGKPTPTYGFQWKLEGTAIGGATEEELVVAKTDEGRSLTCEVTATNKEGQATQTSEPVVVPKHKGAGAPKDIEAPALSGSPALGETLKCSPGSWSGEPTFTYEWLRGGETINSATSQTYAVVEADEGQSLSCRVIAANSEGVGSEDSSDVSVPAERPKDEGLPQIAGSPVIGETLTCEAGQWKGAPAPTYAFQWRLQGRPIAGAERSSYVVGVEDAEGSLTCAVTASNSGGEVSVSSEARMIPGSKPQNTAEPVLSGPARPTSGSTLTCQEGTWSGAPSPVYSFQWLRDGVVIPSASTSTYTVALVDEVHSVSCVVTATNGAGTQKVASNSVRIFGSEPADTSAPTISAEGAALGDSLTCSPGEWTGQPEPTYGYQWTRDGKKIELATSSTYVIGDEDVGQLLACEVTATNLEGDRSADSASIQAAGDPPEKTQVPTLSGPEKPAVGDTLTCSKGTWTGVPEPEYRYKWLREGREIPSQTESSYAIETFDVGYSISCDVTASNSAGEETAESRRIHVPGSRPENTELPQVTGTAAIGETLKCAVGSWNATPTPKFEYQWLLDGGPIPGATASRYSVEPADLGHSISCRVTVTNSEGSAVEMSSNSPDVIARAVLHKFEPPPVAPPETNPTITQPDQLTVAQILADLSAQLAAAEKHARISSLLKARDYRFTLTAPAAGTLELFWYEVPAGAHVASARKPLVVAQAKMSYLTPVQKTVMLRLTKAGLQLIRHSKRIKLTAKAVFSRPSTSALTWLKAFELSR